MLSLHSCRLASSKDKTLVFLEGHLSTRQKGNSSTLENTSELHEHGFHTSFSCTETRHNKKTTRQDPTRCKGHEPEFKVSEDLYHMTETQHSEALKSSWGFAELSR